MLASYSLKFDILKCNYIIAKQIMNGIMFVWVLDFLDLLCRTTMDKKDISVGAILLSANANDWLLSQMNAIVALF